ncbi:MAG: hypothetical protein A3F09_04680 [Chlamydiae bacterium RIFCSPHIGHO2_12_FULL_49_11]|nr:MAG: hypothetical protein A3F09_04680 [Chlamydiae bacterium RIFCSPHIGHO2_12_FULL_49_11]
MKALILFIFFASCHAQQGSKESASPLPLFHGIENEVNSDVTFDEDILLIADRRTSSLRMTRPDQVPDNRLDDETASYQEGYIQALIDENYFELLVRVYVPKPGVVYIYNLPKDDRIRKSIIAFVQDLPGITEVHVVDEPPPDVVAKTEQLKEVRPHIKGVWFPETTVLFPPIIASPHEPVYSVAYRWGDAVIANNQIAVSLGDVFPLFRWFEVGRWKGDLQIDIAACMWADFNMHPKIHPNDEWAELVNTDYLLSIPFSYAVDAWAFRFRIYHISSHLGDEFMVNNPNILRLNPSFEAIEILGSYQATLAFRLYGGPGFIINSDPSYPMKQFYVEYGFEWRFMVLRHHYHSLYGAPFLAIDMQQWQVAGWTPSLTIMAGYEWSKLLNAGRKVRLFFEYHNGYSEGQFFTNRTDYIAIRVSWGF